jgi:ABC-type uncharacterized transport system auxiliary subunit
MLKRLLAILALAAVAAACNPSGTPTPTLSLSSPGGGLESLPTSSELPTESTLTSP